MARGFGSFLLVLLGALAGAVLEANLFSGSEPVGIITLIVTVAVAVWVIVYYQKKNKEELEAEISLLKDKLEQKEKE